MNHTKQRGAHFAARPLALEISRMFRPGVAAMTLAVPFAMAAPQGGTVAAGQAAIQQNGSATTITQGSQRAVVDWRSFNVGASESVNFIQPNASSAILNRVVGNEASAIFGRITANGQVYLVNPNGVLFGRSAQVDVGSLVATTTNLSNASFMSGKLEFNEPGKPGARVENQGSITVGEGGFAALVGHNVANSGVIQARLGKVALAAGDAFVLDLYGDKLVNLIVDPAAMNTLTDAFGQPLAASVDHSGQIMAEGGRVQLSAATVKQLVDNIINVSGVVRATSFTTAPGHISLQGDANTRVAVSGTLDASGDAGGRIDVTGREIKLQPSAVLAADATAHGDGGSVYLMSDDSTQFEGRISARGGALSGNGGSVEVSSKGRLGFMGDVDVAAAQGQQGSILLDPTNLRIGTVTTSDSEISAEQLRTLLIRGANVTLSADQNVTVDAEINGLLTGGGVRGGGLTLTAGNNLTVNKTIALNDGALNLTATAGTLSAVDAALLYAGSGAVTLRGGAGVDVGRILTSGAVDVRSASGAVSLRQAALAAGASAAPVASLNVQAAGNATLNGALASGNIGVNSTGGSVSLRSAVLQSTGGAVTVQAAQGIASVGTGVGLVAGGNVSATAGQAIDLSTALGGGQVQLNAGGAVTVAQAITNAAGNAATGLGVVAGGAVSLTGARTGSGGISVATTAGDVTSSAALVSSGAVSVVTAGRAGTSAARLNVDAGAGAISLQGTQGVNAASLFSTGAITLAASAGGVDVSQAISGAAGAVSAATTSRPTGVAITARDAIVLNGAAVGTGGLTADSSASSVTANTASIFSNGAVNLAAAGAVTLADGVAVDTQGNSSTITLNSRNGALTVGTGGVRANGDAAVNLTARTDIALNGDVQTHAGTITVTSSNGAVTASVADSDTPVAGDAVIDAGADATRSHIAVTGAGRVFLGEMRAYADITVRSTGGNVILRRGLGGGSTTTGYNTYALGYQDALRPNVGRLIVNAADSVELNGLNLDGNALSTDTTAGLSVTATHRIVSNQPIAVNKGDIVLTTDKTLATDGVYLGNNVYSRGWDSVGADGLRGTGDDVKRGYNITITGTVLGMFDNTNEIATVSNGTTLVNVPGRANPVRTDMQGYLVDVNGVRLTPLQVVALDKSDNSSGINIPVTVYTVDANQLITTGPFAGETVNTVHGQVESRDIAKIIISNNTANYQDLTNGVPDTALRAQLVPTAGDTTPNIINLNVDTIAGISNALPAGNRFSIDSFTPTLVAPSQAPVSVAARSGVVASTKGIGLKLLGFEAAGDAELLMWSNSAGMFFGQRFESIGITGLGNLTNVTLVNGRFSLTTPAEAHRTYQVLVGGVTQTRNQTSDIDPGDPNYLSLGHVTYVFELGQGPQQGRVRLVSATGSSDMVLPSANVAITLGTGETLVAGSITPWVAGGTEYLVGDTATLRLHTPVFFTAPGGQVHDITVAGALYPNGAALQPSQTVQAGTAVRPSLQQPTTANFYQDAGVSTVNVSINHPADFLLSRVTVDTSASGSFTNTTRGTRMFIFDGLIETVDSRSISDTIGGVALPGFGAIAGTNNSSAGFASVGAGFAPVGGTATAVTVGTPTSAGATGVSIPSAGVGGLFASDTDRPPQEPLGSDVFGGNLAALNGELLIGQRPAALADMGRSGGVAGSAVNVLRKRFPLVTSTDGTVCSDGNVQPAEGAGKSGGARTCAAGK